MTTTAQTKTWADVQPGDEVRYAGRVWRVTESKMTVSGALSISFVNPSNIRRTTWNMFRPGDVVTVA